MQKHWVCKDFSNIGARVIYMWLTSIIDYSHLWPMIQLEWKLPANRHGCQLIVTQCHRMFQIFAIIWSHNDIDNTVIDIELLNLTLICWFWPWLVKFDLDLLSLTFSSFRHFHPKRPMSLSFLKESSGLWNFIGWFSMLVSTPFKCYQIM